MSLPAGTYATLLPLQPPHACSWASWRARTPGFCLGSGVRIQIRIRGRGVSYTPVNVLIARRQTRILCAVLGVRDANRRRVPLTGWCWADMPAWIQKHPGSETEPVWGLPPTVSRGCVFLILRPGSNPAFFEQIMRQKLLPAGWLPQTARLLLINGFISFCHCLPWSHVTRL